MAKTCKRIASKTARNSSVLLFGCGPPRPTDRAFSTIALPPNLDRTRAVIVCFTHLCWGGSCTVTHSALLKGDSATVLPTLITSVFHILYAHWQFLIIGSSL